MLFTSEQVSSGHPDKICDQISDAIVTDCLLNDRDSRVAVECMIKDYDITIAGEITSSHTPDFKDLTYCVLAGIGLPNIDQYTVNRLISKRRQLSMIPGMSCSQITSSKSRVSVLAS